MKTPTQNQDMTFEQWLEAAPKVFGKADSRKATLEIELPLNRWMALVEAAAVNGCSVANVIEYLASSEAVGDWSNSNYSMCDRTPPIRFNEFTTL